MFKLVLISALVVAATCAPADKPNQQGLEQSETQWNAAWANPAANPNAAWQNPNAAWGANSWNRWGNNPADPRTRWAGAGADPWNRNPAAWNNPTAWNAQPWNRAAGAWPAAGAPAAGARGWNPW